MNKEFATQRMKQEQPAVEAAPLSQMEQAAQELFEQQFPAESIATTLEDQRKPYFGKRKESVRLGAIIEIGSSQRTAEDEPDRIGQDAIFADEKTGLVGVADGAGGYKDGAVASRYVTTHAPAMYEKVRAENLPVTPERIKQFAEEQVRESLLGNEDPDIEQKTEKMIQELKAVPKEVLDELLTFRSMYEALHAQAAKDTEFSGTTTLAAGKIVEANGERYIVVLSVGDSPIKKIRTNGTMATLVKEQTLIESLNINDPNIDHNIPMYRGRLSSVFNKEEINLPFITARKLAPGEIIAFMSDGVTDNTELTEKLPGILAELPAGANRAQRITKFLHEKRKGGAPFDNDDATALFLTNAPALTHAAKLAIRQSLIDQPDQIAA